MSNTATTDLTSQSQQQARRLELSVNPTDGSLLTASLTQVLLASTDALYTELYNMAQGELDVTTAQQAADDEEGDANPQVAALAVHHQLTKRERMSNLSFAQRRHELAWRLAMHGKALQHTAALTAANASSDLAAAVAVSSRALQHARTAWMQADEAQDALYFFHAQLFPVRAAPHDVYGALDIQLIGTWLDLPRDLILAVDRFESSEESAWSKDEVDQRWQLAVRDKLLRGEVGWNKLQQYQQQPCISVVDSNSISESVRQSPLHSTQMNPSFSSHQTQPQSLFSTNSFMPPSFPWKLTLRGGILQLTHGQPKQLEGHDDVFPIKALLTVLSPNTIVASTSPLSFTATDNAAQLNGLHKHNENSLSLTAPPPGWTLLSLDVRVQAKTGEFNHQLETSNRQRYDLHRLAALAMGREEARARRQISKLHPTASTAFPRAISDDEQVDISNEMSSPISSTNTIPPAQPLHALFQVTQTFLLSWQLELLSAQAQALRRGVWAAGESNPIQVTPVQFVDQESHYYNGQISGKDGHNGMLGVVSVSFWKVDDAYGPPSTGDLTLLLEDGENQANDLSQSQLQQQSTAGRFHHANFNNQLTMSIRAEIQTGMRVSINGAQSIIQAIQAGQTHVRETTRDLLEAASNPLALSVSDALLAATRLCAELKCQAVVEALQPSTSNKNAGLSSLLPNWILLCVERGRIDVAVRVRYHGISLLSNSGMPILFRLLCDARTGSFVNTYPRQTKLLRHLACNNYDASESMSLRLASLPLNRRRTAGASSSGRLVRDAFEGLIRSMNVLGQRVGVGGCWDNVDDQSALLRERAIQSACIDVKASLIKCCGMAALFGLTPLAVAGAVGLDACSDIAGCALESLDGFEFFAVPPLGVLVNQQLIESSTTSDGVSKKTAYLEQSLFATVCTVDEDGLTLFPVDVRVKLTSPSSVAERIGAELSIFQLPISQENDEPPFKRVKHEEINGYADTRTSEDIMTEVSFFASFMASTLEPEMNGEILHKML